MKRPKAIGRGRPKSREDGKTFPQEEALALARFSACLPEPYAWSFTVLVDEDDAGRLEGAPHSCYVVWQA